MSETLKLTASETVTITSRCGIPTRSRLAGPDLVLRPALAALGAIGRLRGYRAVA